MAVSIDDIKKLRAMTGAGLADVKKALTEAEGDFDKAKDLLRERGLAIAAKRSDRETSNGCVLVKKVDGFAAIVALKCETDFVANGADFIKLTSDILDAAIAAKAHTLDEVKALTLADGSAVQDAITQRSGITGEKMELDGYNVLEGDNIEVYDHMGKHTLATMVQLNKENAELGHKMAMQVAAMKPIALDEESVPQEVKDNEFQVAVQKTKEEQIEKAVEVALKKAGLNPNLVDSEDHIESNIKKGWLTREEADKALVIKKEAAEQKAANMPEQMIQNIAKGRLAKFLKECCLVNQEFQFGDGVPVPKIHFKVEPPEDKKATADKLLVRAQTIQTLASSGFIPELEEVSKIFSLPMRYEPPQTGFGQQGSLGLATDVPEGDGGVGGTCGSLPPDKRAIMYGTLIRGGLLTPTRDLEEKIRAELGLAPLPAEAQRLWDETGGVRKPLTLKEPTPLPTGNAIGLGAEQKKRSDAAELADALTEWLGPLAAELDQLSADTEISDEEFSRRLSACAEGRKNGSTGKLETFLEGQIYDGMARGMTS